MSSLAQNLKGGDYDANSPALLSAASIVLAIRNCSTNALAVRALIMTEVAMRKDMVLSTRPLEKSTAGCDALKLIGIGKSSRRIDRFHLSAGL